MGKCMGTCPYSIITARTVWVTFAHTVWVTVAHANCPYSMVNVWVTPHTVWVYIYILVHEYNYMYAYVWPTAHTVWHMYGTCMGTAHTLRGQT